MSRFSVVQLMLLLMALIASSTSGATTQSLLAAGEGDRQWIVHQLIDEGKITSRIQYKADADTGWKLLTQLDQSIDAVAAVGPELAVLPSGRDWRIYWSSDWRYGRALGRGMRMLTLAASGQQVFAIVVPDNTTPDPAPQPATQPEATTRPATRPVAAPPVITRATLMKFADGNWSAVALLPDEVDPQTPAELSLATVGDQPMLAARRDGRIKLWTLEGATWNLLGAVDSVPDVYFAALRGQTPRLWVDGENDAGVIHRWVGGGHEVIDLKTAGASAQSTVRTVAMMGERLHLIAADGTALVIVPLNDDGTPAAEAVTIAAPHPVADPHVGQWLQGVLVAAMLFVIFSTLRQRQLEPPVTRPLDGLQLARLKLRAMAGIIDLWPMWIAFVILGRWSISSTASIDLTLMESRAQYLLLGAAGVYVLHTMIAELLTGRSLGKMFFGLRVVGFDGGKVKRSGLVIRNLLRLLDVYVLFPLPLMLVMYTPLRQRLGDLAAQTIVVEKATTPPADADQEQVSD